MEAERDEIRQWNLLRSLVGLPKLTVEEYRVQEAARQASGLVKFQQSEKAHHCNCDNATRCKIHTHPSQKVQDALNLLMDAMAEFDEQTESESVLTFQSVHKTGVFTSITKRAQ